MKKIALASLVSIYSILIIVFGFVLVNNKLVYAWDTDSTINTLIAQNSKNLVSHAIVEDGTRGSYVLYSDETANGSIYVNRINGVGEKVWGEEKIIGSLTSWLDGTSRISMVSDLSGGVIVVWEGKKDTYSHVYAQRIDPDGNLLWNDGGLLVSLSINYNSLSPQSVSDGDGGVIVSWVYNNSSALVKVKSQRVDKNGALMWGIDGVDLTGWRNRDRFIKIASDDNGGAYILYRGDTFQKLAIQQIDANGTLKWPIDSKVLSTTTNSFLSNYSLYKDNLGGVYAFWLSSENGVTKNRYQRINITSGFLWGENGLSFPISGEITSDKYGNLLILNSVRLDSENADLYMSKFNRDGIVQWNGMNIPIFVSPGAQFLNDLQVDSDDNVIVVWNDYFNGGIGNNQNNPAESTLYAQKISPDGEILWQEGGVVVSNAPGSQTGAEIAQVDEDGYVVVWSDTRNGTNSDIYAQRINIDGTLGNRSELESCVIRNFPEVILQNDKEWGDIPYGGIYRVINGENKLIPFKYHELNPANDWRDSIANWGCTMTSYAMLINYHAALQNIDFETNPLILNEWLQRNNGFNVGHYYPNEDNPVYVDSSLVIPNKIIEYAKENDVYVTLKERPIKGDESYSDYLTRVEEFLDNSLCEQSNPAMFQVSNSSRPTHFVVASGKLVNPDPDTYQLHDPLEQNIVTLNDIYNNRYLSYRIMEDSIVSLDSIYLSIASPVHALVTDPSGKKLGYDPRTNQWFYEIPEGIYTTETISDIHGESMPIHKILSIPNKIKGDYKIEIIGTDVGEYALNILVNNEDGSQIEKYIVGNSKKDNLETYILQNLDSNHNGIIKQIPMTIDPFNNHDILISPKGGAVVGATVYSTISFDSNQISPESYKLGPLGAVTPFKIGIKKDYNNDGYIDVKLLFRKKEVGIEYNTKSLCINFQDNNDLQLRGCDNVNVMSLREFSDYLKNKH